MSDHVTQKDLHGLLSGSLDRERAREMVAHLLRGCEACRSVALLQAKELKPLPESETEIPPALNAAYDAAIQRALRGARRQLKLMRVQVSRQANVPSVEAFLQQSWDLRQDDPKQMLHFALLATIEAERLDPAALGAAKVEDIRCRAALELGNAYRVSNRLQEAEEALREAAERFRRSTGDSRLKARLLDVRASLYGAQRSFGLCFSTLDVVIALYRELGESHLAGRALITKAVYTRYSGEPEKAVELSLREGVSLIDPERDPKLTLNAVHNLAWLMVDHNRFRDARKLLWENRPLYEQHGGAVGTLRLRWLEGRVNAGLGKLDLAERDLRTAHEGLEAAGIPYTAAIAALDLAEVELRRNRPDEAESLALDAVQVFLSLEISREAHTAVLFLEEAANRRMMTGNVLRHVADFLRQAEGAQPARFEPAE